MRVAVAGGTGLVGRLVVREARSRGHEVVVLARAEGVDLTTGEGAAEALAGADAVVDVLNVPTQKAQVATDFFTTTTRTLLAAEVAAGVGHHLLLSIVGVEDVPLGYYRGKVAQEQAVRAGAVPWSILRATQFHEFADQVLAQTTFGPVAVVPNLLSQPIAAREVAAALVDAAEAGPSGLLPDLAGPGREHLADLARRSLRARHRRTLVVPVPLPGAAGRAVRAGKLLPPAPGPRGVQTFEEWLLSGGSVGGGSISGGATP